MLHITERTDNIMHLDEKDLGYIVAMNTAVNGRVSWVGVAEKMGWGTEEMWRSRWRRMAVAETNQPMRKRPLSDVGIEAVELLRKQGHNIEIWFEDNVLWCMEKPLPRATTSVGTLGDFTGSTLVIGVVSDTHIGNEHSQIEALTEFYAHARERGVEVVYHVGDLTDGMYPNRSDSFYEQDAHGFSEQVRKVVEVYPRITGVETRFITGNHDVTHMRNGGASVGETVAALRDDMVYLGHNFAKEWLTPHCSMNLVHPFDGVVQNVTWKLQKYIDGAIGARKSDILLMGHYHKQGYIYYKGTHGFMVPSFEGQTGFMTSANIESYIGGYVLTLQFDADGYLRTITSEAVVFDAE